ncbi:MBL fold metallo-hydrolase [Candidatus Kaiserbacteria bacterium]|nr:MBL fold metallo-hydrolase [Candidatus Kaiserbacteria bacterium]
MWHSTRARSTVLLVVLLVGLVTSFLSAYGYSLNHFLSATVFSGGERCDPGLLCVYFLDVGQGDAIFIETPDGHQMLIDGGPGSDVLRELGAVMSFFDRTIDVVLATHPDQDHVGGLVDVLDRYTVGAVLMTENKSDTPVYNRLTEAVSDEGAAVHYARAGDTLVLGEGVAGEVRFEVLYPDRDPTLLESNTSSIVGRLVYGDTEWMLTGDAPQAIEEYLVALFGVTLHSDVLKVGHHGSKTATAETFVSAVAPDYAVISAGKNNRYGHPHQEVLDTLEAAGIEIKNTADEGSIKFSSDGAWVSVE